MSVGRYADVPDMLCRCGCSKPRTRHETPPPRTHLRIGTGHQELATFLAAARLLRVYADIPLGLGPFDLQQAVHHCQVEEFDDTSFATL